MLSITLALLLLLQLQCIVVREYGTAPTNLEYPLIPTWVPSARPVPHDYTRFATLD